MNDVRRAGFVAHVVGFPSYSRFALVYLSFVRLSLFTGVISNP
jgi:hypothetical protein